MHLISRMMMLLVPMPYFQNNIYVVYFYIFNLKVNDAIEINCLVTRPNEREWGIGDPSRSSDSMLTSLIQC